MQLLFKGMLSFVLLPLQGNLGSDSPTAIHFPVQSSLLKARIFSPRLDLCGKCEIRSRHGWRKGGNFPGFVGTLPVFCANLTTSMSLSVQRFRLGISSPDPKARCQRSADSQKSLSKRERGRERRKRSSERCAELTYKQHFKDINKY